MAIDDWSSPSSLDEWSSSSKATPSGTMGEVLFPRTSKAKGAKKILGAAADISTGVLRVPAAAGGALADMLGLNSETPAFGRVPEGTTFKKGLEDLNAGRDEWGQPNAIARMGQDPATVPSTLVGGGLARPAVTALGRMGVGAVSGLAQGLTSGLAHEATKYSQGEGFSPTEAAKEGLAGAVGGAALSAGGEALTGAGKGIVGKFLKPGHTGKGEGFDVENVFKHNLGGSAKTMTKKVDDLLTNLRGEQSSAIAANATAPVNVGDVYLDLTNSVKQDVLAGKHFGDESVVDAQMQRYASSLKNLIDPHTGNVNLDVAWEIKKKAQGDAAALFKAYNRNQSTDDLAKQKVAASFAKKITDLIESQHPEVTRPNKTFSEVIPIGQVLGRRNVIAGQNNPIGLDEYAALTAGAEFMNSGHPEAGLLPFLAKGLKMPSVGNALYKTGKAAQGPKARTILNLLTGDRE